MEGLLLLPRTPLAGDLEGKTARIATAKARSLIFAPWASVGVSEKGPVVGKAKATKAGVKLKVRGSGEEGSSMPALKANLLILNSGTSAGVSMEIIGPKNRERACDN